MSEMLANHYFLVRNFISAKTIFENIVTKDSTNKIASKKLIICYVTSGEIDKALNLFLSLIKSDIDFIINTDIKADDCPCPDIISEIENGAKLGNNTEKSTALGILWLYCNPRQSLEYFQNAEKSNPTEKRLREINTIIEERIKALNQKSYN